MNRTDINPAPAAVEHKDMANVIRALSMDAVQAANSGHPGMPMGMADVATVLYRRFLKFDPAWPQWPDRDRFVLSAGHGSMLLYSLLYLSGYKGIGIGDLKKFRQLHARCAGHPEYDPGLGIETTTGPLGQGIANGVGMALAERMSAARYGSEMVDHQTYVIAGDGCLMEGISHEAISFAGHMKLGKLMVLFDDNQISIDGPTDLSVSDDQIARFKASGWYCQSVDGHDPLAIANAIGRAKQSDQPSMIACRTIIGYGSPNKQGTSSTHGAPLGADEIAATREALGWPHGPFEVPDTVLDAWRRTGTRSGDAVEGWRESYQAMPEDMRAEFDRTISGDLPSGFDDAINDLKSRLAADGPVVATRKASQMALEAINALVPETIAGSADLTGSVNTKTSDTPVITPTDFSGRFIHYGVREHAMGGIMNGIALHKGFIPYSGTFMVFSDYARPAIRLSALMRQRVIYVMTHDSIGLGEDGPTHQPVEHLASLRAMPNLLVLRPADTVETAECWAIALKSRTTPSVISLTRQGVPALRRAHTDDNLCARGGYELSAAEGDAQVTLISTGSEVGIAIEAQALLADGGIAARVVSMPCTELFDDQDADYRAATLGPGTLRVAIEAGATYGWDRYVGETGAIIGMTSFGASAPAKDLYKHFGITADAVVAAVRERI